MGIQFKDVMIKPISVNAEDQIASSPYRIRDCQSEIDAPQYRPASRSLSWIRNAVSRCTATAPLEREVTINQATGPQRRGKFIYMDRWNAVSRPPAIWRTNRTFLFDFGSGANLLRLLGRGVMKSMADGPDGKTDIEVSQSNLGLDDISCS